jgi:hypothetical protein
MGYYDEYLEHHGILGQKWGVRRFENAAGHLTAAGKNRYNQINGEYQKLKKKVTNKVESTGERKKEDTAEPEKKGLTDKQKKMIVAGAAVVGTAVAAYGGYKLYQHMENTKKEAHDLLIERGNQATMKALQSEHAKEMNAVRDYVEAKNSRDGHHTNNGGLLVDPEAYKNHWVGVAQKNKAEINKAHADYMKKADNISSSYRQSKKYLQATKNNKQGDVANREWYLNGYDIGHFTKKEKTKKSDTLKSQKAVESVQEKYKKDLAQWRKGSMTTPPPIPPSASKSGAKATNRLASEASSLARSVTAEGPRSFSSRSTQNSANAVRAMTSQKLANATRTTSSGRQVTQRVMSVAGQQKFSQASQANSDLVNELLKKNASMLAGF